MTAFITIADHPFNAQHREQFEVVPGVVLSDWLAMTAGVDLQKLQDEPPIAVSLNGEQLPIDQWGYVLCADDHVSVLPRQYGVEMAWGIVAMIGAAAVASFLLMPEIPAQPNQLDQAKSPSYSADAQGNRARLGSPIPVPYGRVRMWPDFATQPWRDYADHNQYLYQLFSLGQTQAQYSDIRIGDTPLTSFGDVEQAIYQPGEPVALFPAAVIESDEVRDIQLWAPNEEKHAEDPMSPAVVAVPAGKSVRRIACDMVFPGGLFASYKGIQEVTVAVLIWTRPIDDDGVPTGDWQQQLYREFRAATIEVQRYTLEFDVTGRVEVRCERTTNQPESMQSHQYKTDVHWAGLRAYLDEDLTFDHPVLALKMRVDDQLTSLSERKINLQVESMLPTWAPGVGWSAPVITRNPAWAFCDAIRAEYGGQFTDEMLTPDIYALAQAWDAENVYFDGIFDTSGRLWDTLKQICAVGLAEPTLIGGVFGIRRDVQEVPEYTYGMADMVAGSFSIEYVTYDQWGNDSVEVEYTDPQTWKPATVMCSVTGTTDRPQQIKLMGCTDLALASRIGHHMAARREFRNRRVRWQTELNGRLPSYGDTVKVSHEYPQWGVSGTILSVDPDGRTIELSEPVDVGSGGWIEIPGPNGKGQGPFAVTQGVDDFHVVLPADHGAVIRTPETEPSKFHSTFVGAVTAESVGLPVKIRSLRAVSDYVVEITGEHDAPEVYSPDALPLPVPPGVVAAETLDITGLRVAQQGTVDRPVLVVSWNPVRPALHYRVEFAYGDALYTFADQPDQPHTSIATEPGVVRLRVAAVNAVGAGPWATLTVTAGADIVAPPAPNNLHLKSAFVGLQADFEWDEVAEADYVVSVTDGGSTVYRVEAVADPAYAYTAAMAQVDGCGREFTVHVSSRSGGRLSESPAVLAVRNEPPSALTGIVVVPGADSLSVKFDAPPAQDLAGFVVYCGPSPVTTDSPEYVIEGRTSLVQIPILDDAIYRVRIAAFDAWGRDEINLSAETADIAAGIREGQLAQAVRSEIEKIPALDTAMAGIESSVDVLDSENLAQASQISTLQAQSSSQSSAIASVQSTQNAQANDIGDLEAQWITRVKAGSNQSYIAMRAASGDPSQLILGAHEVAIGNPGAERFPFKMIGSTLYLGDTQIENASITRLHLANIPVINSSVSIVNGVGDGTFYHNLGRNVVCLVALSPPAGYQLTSEVCIYMDANRTTHRFSIFNNAGVGYNGTLSVQFTHL